MKFIIKGAGLDVVLITLGCFYLFHHFIGKSILILSASLVASGAFIWFYSRFRKIRDVSKSGKPGIHSLLGIRIQYWSVLIGATGIVLIISWVLHFL